ncbi:MAG: ABC transporter ATP-binding protein [Chloroflexi bacterium]|nr:ABC transporter ATP-binding protein [Chloroflexota bacterium]
MSPEPLLQVQDVVKVFDLPHRGFFGAARRLRALAGVSLDIFAEETLGLVGESGCGKTTLGRIIVRLETATAGRVLFRGRDVRARAESTQSADRRSIQMVFQDATGSLNPRRRVRDIVSLPVKAGGVVAPGLVDDHVSQVLEEVGLPSELGGRYPGQLSGGQQQRVALARAIALEPAVLVADEPLSALDVSVQAQILRLLERIRERRHLAMLFVSHDLAVVRYLCDRVAVMYLGRIVESGPVDEVFEHPRHPYTVALLSAVPSTRQRTDVPIELAGEVPSAADIPPGCPFHPRCWKAQDKCRTVLPRLDPLDGARVACHFPE